MRIAAAQTRPVWLDATATAKKVTQWLSEAAAQDVELVAFPEAFLSGYPFWLEFINGSRYDDPLQQRAYASYLDSAVERNGPELATVVEAARDLGVFVYLGTTERGTDHGRGSFYSTLFAIDPNRGVVSSHRKLIPVFEERLVWEPGDGHGLRTHQAGDLRVGGLNCWENWMPQARHAIYAGGADLHISVWPGNPEDTVDITRLIAREGRVWSLAACGVLSMDDVPGDFPLRSALEQARLDTIRWGGSAVAAPDGAWVVKPVVDEERLVVADIDLASVRAARQALDPSGHHSRPDVFSVTVDRSRRSAGGFVD